MKALKPSRLLDGGGGESAARMRELLARLEHERLFAPGEESARRARVWRRLENGERPARARFRALAAGAAACGASVLLLLLAARGARERPAQDASALRLSLASGHLYSGAVELSAGAALAGGAPLRTDSSRSGVVRIDSLAELVVQPGSEIAISSRASETVIALAQGEVVADVSELQPPRELLVETGGVRVRVVGARFWVRCSAAGSFVSVSSGSVLLEQGSTSERVPAGQSWSSAVAARRESDTNSARADAAAGPGADPAASPRVDSSAGPGRNAAASRSLIADAKRSAAADARGGAELATRGASSARAAPSRPAALELASRAAPVGGTPTHTKSGGATSAIGHEPFLEESPLAGPTAAPEPARPGVAPQASEAPPPPPLPPLPAQQGAPLPAPPESSRVATADASDAYTKAKQLLARGEPAAAAAAFTSIVERRGPHRELALYELGRVRQRELGDTDGALAAFRRYRADFPAGALSREVELSLIDLELGRGQPADRAAALEGISAFLRDNPASERGAEMHLLRGNLLRERGDCADAILDYQQAGGSSAGDALWFTAFCQRKLGQQSQAQSSLRDYLVHFPSGVHRAEATAALDSTAP